MNYSWDVFRAKFFIVFSCCVSFICTIHPMRRDLNRKIYRKVSNKVRPDYIIE